MLDATEEGPNEDTIAADDAQDTVAAPDGEDTVAADTGEELVISIEGEEPEADPDAEIEAELGDKGKRALKALREADKAKAARIRELEAKVAEVAPVKRDDELGQRPIIADYGFNDDLHATALEAWLEKKRAADAKKAEEAARQKAANDAYQTKLTKYHEDRTKIGVDDDAQAVVVAALTPQQQTALMDASLDPAKVVAALAKTPKVLKELADIKEIHKFTYRLAQVEGKIVMAPKPPPPESKLRGGGGAAAGATLSKQLEAAEKTAERTGDRTEVIRIRRQMRDAGVTA